METFTMSRKEAPRPGLLKAAVAGRITNAEGAQALRLSVRQFQRLKVRFRAQGLASVPHGLRGRASNRQAAPGLRARVTTLIRTTYAGFNDVHLTEKLREVHGLRISRASVRRLRLGLGLPAQRPRRAPPYRSRRPRADARGRLVQLDGSVFAWLEDRGPALTLLGAIDDATSEVLALWFRPHEDLHGYATLLEQVCARYGLPVALYGDRLNVFVRNDHYWSLDEELAGAQTPTHFGCILADLGIGYVAAQSPQGKGRVERLWGTLQDRLVSELRLRGIATLDAANAFLPAYMADHNRRFAQRAPDGPTAWRPTPRDLARLLSCRYSRVVARDNTVTLGARVVQLPARAHGRVWAERRVEVRELLNGRLLVLAEGVLLAQQAAPPGFTLVPRRAPKLARIPRTAPPRERRTPYSPPEPRPPRGALSTPSRKLPARPAQTHPWLRSLKYHVARKALRARLRSERRTQG
jgi:transposase